MANLPMGKRYDPHMGTGSKPAVRVAWLSLARLHSAEEHVTKSHSKGIVSVSAVYTMAEGPCRDVCESHHL